MDKVCLTVRLGEELAIFGVDVIIVESMRAKPTGLHARALGRINVRGRTQPVAIFALPSEPRAERDRKGD